MSDPGLRSDVLSGTALPIGDATTSVEGVTPSLGGTAPSEGIAPPPDRGGAPPDGVADGVDDVVAEETEEAAGTAEEAASGAEAETADTAEEAEAMPLSLHATAALLGEYRWIENTLYGMLGGWVEDVPIPAVQVHLDAQSMRHAWHAELWADRLPVLADVDPGSLTVPSRPTAVLFAALLGAVLPSDEPGSSWPPLADGKNHPPGALPKLAGLYRVVLPRLVTSYERHLAVAGTAADAPVIRGLRLVLNDEIDDWLAGERLVQRLVSRPHDVAAVYEFQQRLEAAVVAAGANSGLVPFPAGVPAG